MSTVRRRRAPALAAALVLAGCSSGDHAEESQPKTTTGRSAPAPTTTAPTVALPTTTETETRTEPRRVTTTKTTKEPKVATEPSRPARAAPPSRVGTLRFDRIVVAPEDGRFGGHANVTNEGTAFLNRFVLRWRIVARDGRELDRGTATLATLAPQETATIELRGRAPYRADWARVLFGRG